MNTNGIVACWHVRDYCRLRANLKRGICDLPEQPQADIWVKRMRLQRGNRVQFCIGAKHPDKALAGLIVATGTIDSEPHPCKHPEDTDFPMCVDIKDFNWIEPPLERCRCYQINAPKGSHRLGGKGPCS